MISGLFSFSGLGGVTNIEGENMRTARVGVIVADAGRVGVVVVVVVVVGVTVIVGVIVVVIIVVGGRGGLAVLREKGVGGREGRAGAVGGRVYG